MKLDSEINFVKSQITAQEKMILKYEDQPKRAELHALTKVRFESLLKKIESIAAQDIVADGVRASASENPDNKLAGVHLTLEDIESAPPELMAELNVSDSDRQEMVIVDIIARFGGIASLDKIIVVFSKRLGEIIKRTTMTSKLFRMVEKRMLFNVPGKRGIYSTYEMSEEQVGMIFGRSAGDADEVNQASADAPSRLAQNVRHSRFSVGSRITPSYPVTTADKND